MLCNSVHYIVLGSYDRRNYEIVLLFLFEYMFRVLHQAPNNNQMVYILYDIYYVYGEYPLLISYIFFQSKHIRK